MAQLPLTVAKNKKIEHKVSQETRFCIARPWPPHSCCGWAICGTTDVSETERNGAADFNARQNA
jgi:hypothetical protein